MKRLILIALAYVVLTSCMPYHYTSVPHTYGKVIDRDTGVPIAGARVYFKEHPTAMVITASDGTFDMPQLKEWITVPLGPFDATPPRLTLVVDAEGYRMVDIGNLRSWEISMDKIELIRK